MQGRRNIVRHYVVVIGLAALGFGCAVYVLAHQGSGLSSPWSNNYDVKVELPAADGVVAGIGQPVDVAGVGVGSIVDAKLDASGSALLTLEIQRGQLPRIYRNASAALEPITPLDDMRIQLDPGSPPAAVLPAGATIGTGQTTSPVRLSDILAALDGDTRDYLASLISSLGEGTAGQGENMRRALLALGPTTAQVHRISGALAQRRDALAQLVHNLAKVTLAATRDRQLSAVVLAGDQTLHAVARESGPLQSAITELPGTLQSLRRTLGYAATLAGKLQPTVAALLPAVRRLPGTLTVLRPFASTTASALSTEVNPFVKQAQPLIRNLSVAMPRLTALAPHMTSSFQGLDYILNELAYNPRNVVNGYRDEGGLFWLDWFVHNWNSDFANSDANGAIGKAAFTGSCGIPLSVVNAAITDIVHAEINLPALCPK